LAVRGDEAGCVAGSGSDVGDGAEPPGVAKGASSERPSAGAEVGGNSPGALTDDS